MTRAADLQVGVAYPCQPAGALVVRGVTAFAAFRLGRGVAAEHDSGDFAPVSCIRRRVQKAGVCR